MRLISVILIVSLFSGCSTQPTKLYGGSTYATLSSKCDSKCAAVVEARFSEFRFGMYGARISPALIKSVDASKGQNSYGGELKFNSDWDGGYELLVDSGERKLELQVNNYMAIYKKSVVINISVSERGRYFVGQVIKSEGEGRTYQWAPVVYSYVTGQLLESEKLNKLYSE